MNIKTWLLQDGKVFKLVEVVNTRHEAERLAAVLAENCEVVISKMEDGKLGVYWRPRVGVICPLGVV